MWSLNFTLILEPCRDTDAGHTDQDGDGCNAYSNPGACGDYDLGDFEANAMCCICGGGSNIGKYQVNICVNIIVIDTYNKVYIKEYKENKVKNLNHLFYILVQCCRELTVASTGITAQFQSSSLGDYEYNGISNGKFSYKKKTEINSFFILLAGIGWYGI